MSAAISKAEYEAKLASMMPEKTLQEHIRVLVRELRATVDQTLLYYHTQRSQHSPAGFPDVVIISKRHLLQIVAELKREGKRYKASEAQEEWLDAYQELGIDTFLWRPRHWLSGEIQRVIEAIAVGRNPQFLNDVVGWWRT